MATIQMKVRPEDLARGSSRARAGSRPGDHGDFRRVGRPDEAQAAACLFHLEQNGLLPEKFAIVGVARRPLGDEFAEDMREGIVQFGGVDNDRSQAG